MESKVVNVRLNSTALKEKDFTFPSLAMSLWMLLRCSMLFSEHKPGKSPQEILYLRPQQRQTLWSLLSSKVRSKCERAVLVPDIQKKKEFWNKSAEISCTSNNEELQKMLSSDLQFTGNSPEFPFLIFPLWVTNFLLWMTWNFTLSKYYRKH